MIFPSTQRGGVEEYALTIANSAIKQGWEVHAAFPRTEATACLIQDFQAQGVRYHCLKIAEESTNKLETVVKHFLRLIRTVFLLLKLKPNVVQINLPWADHCFGSILACGLLRIPTIVVFQLMPFYISIGSIKSKLYAWARARNQQWIAVSKHNRQLVCKSFEIPKEQVLCIYNGTKLIPDTINGDDKDIDTLRTQLRQGLGIPDSRVVLTIGRLHSQKGHSDLIPAIPHIIKEFPEVRFVWVGDGELTQYLKKSSARIQS